MKKTTLIIVTLLFALAASWALADDARKPRILYVDSYHPEYLWVQEITEGILQTLAITVDANGELDDSESSVTLRIVHMDTKRNKTEGFKQKASLEVKELIDRWQPDVVIASDDNASKYLIQPYYKNADIPFVFCGVNWDASVYGFPYDNVTGMIEVTLVPQLLEILGQYATGTRIGLIAGNTISEEKIVANLKKHFALDLTVRLVDTVDQFKMAYQELQTKCDILLMNEIQSTEGYDEKEMIAFIRENTRIPTGGVYTFMVPLVMVTCAATGIEQGEWAAQTALKIIEGTSPKDIPIVKNKRAKIYLNMTLAKKLGIKFPLELIENAHLISAEQKKMFYVNSYHKGYQWSDDIQKGLLKALDIREKPDGTYDTSGSDIELKVFRMDTKLNKSEAFKKQAALSAKAIIDEWKPDIVVASDDNASKYLIAPYYKKSAIPFVFCGLNWDASVYGFPAPNITGMVEVEPALETIEILKEYANGDRIGFIGVESITGQKSVDNYVSRLGINFSDGKLVSDFSEWKEEYLRLQDSVDMILWFNPIGITGWDSEPAEKFILENTKIPTGATADNNKRFALLGIVKIAEEQGWWAGKTALQILGGKSPADIPVVTNKGSRVYLNMPLAKRLGIKFPMELIEKATLLESRPD